MFLAYVKQISVHGGYITKQGHLLSCGAAKNTLYLHLQMLMHLHLARADAHFGVFYRGKASQVMAVSKEDATQFVENEWMVKVLIYIF